MLRVEYPCAQRRDAWTTCLAARRRGSSYHNSCCSRIWNRASAGRISTESTCDELRSSKNRDRGRNSTFMKLRSVSTARKRNELHVEFPSHLQPFLGCKKFVLVASRRLSGIRHFRMGHDDSVVADRTQPFSHPRLKRRRAAQIVYAGKIRVGM